MQGLHVAAHVSVENYRGAFSLDTGWLDVGRYALNIAFNLSNKTVFNYFPFPWTVSALHVVVGALYCGATYLLGFKDASFGRVNTAPHIILNLSP